MVATEERMFSARDDEVCHIAMALATTADQSERMDHAA
jgi:hypothetical protein